MYHDWDAAETEGEYRMFVATKCNDYGYFFVRLLDDSNNCWVAYHQGKLIRQFFDSMEEAQAYCDKKFTEPI